MLSPEILRKVRWIELSTRKLVTDAMTGQYKSHFKGQGMQFADHREYLAGDDVRHIDWKVSARTREPMLKKFEEERELTMLLVVDVSGSGAFGSSKLKSEAAAEIAGMLSYAAMHSGDKVGVLLFAGDVELSIPPKKGRQHAYRIIKEVLTFEPKTRGTDLKKALEAAGRVMKHSGIVFLISDFMATGYETSLRRLARRHDVIAITVGDERESVIPAIGHLHFTDPETGEEKFVNTNSYAFKKWHKDYIAGLEARTSAALKASKLERIRIKTKDDYAEAVVRFFRGRTKVRK